MSEITINNSNVVFNTPPKFQQKGKHFKRMLRIGKLRFYLTWDYRLKNSSQRDQKRNHNGIVKVKETLWHKHEGHCQMCGKKIDRYCSSQVHHIINWFRAPQFETDERNLMLLCRDCHKEIHCNPFLECKMITEKADELGINLKDYYDV